MHDAAEFLDALAEPAQLIFADLVVLGIPRLGVGLLQLLEHRPFAMTVLRPDAVKTAVQPFCERTQERDVVIVRRVERRREQQAMIKLFSGLMKLERRILVEAVV